MNRVVRQFALLTLLTVIGTMVSVPNLAASNGRGGHKTEDRDRGRDRDRDRDRGRDHDGDRDRNHAHGHHGHDR